MYRTLIIGALLFTMSAQAADPTWPHVIPAPHGAVILPTARDKQGYDDYHYAAVRRVDNMLYISGVVMGRREGEGRDVAAYRLQLRRGFERLRQMLTAAGASFADVVMINSFHVWNGPEFSGTRDEQFDVFLAVADEFMPPPYPASTAVGTSGLMVEGGIVEVQLIARVPDAK